MRALHLILIGLATFLPTAAAQPDALLFEDARGDVGPWPLMYPGIGAPAPAEMDLLAARLAEGLLVLEVASLPDAPPRDRLWSAGWTRDDGAYAGLGYTTWGGSAAAEACVFPESTEYGPSGEPTCEPVEAALRAGSPGAFLLALPDGFAWGNLTDPSGAAMLTPDGVAPQLGLLYAGGLTMLDLGMGEDVAAPMPSDDVLTTAAAEERAVPGAAPAALLVVLAALARAARREG